MIEDVELLDTESEDENEPESKREEVHEPKREEVHLDPFNAELIN